LLLDEPLAALDRKLREETRLELAGIQQRIGTTFLVVTHDQEEALGMASRIAVMNRGEIAQIGSPAAIYERPLSRFVAGFVGAVNLFEGEIVAGFNALALATPQTADLIPLAEPLDLPVGASIAVAVRPEKLRLSVERPPGFAFSATVASVGYQGSQSTIHLITETGQKLRADLPSAATVAFERDTQLWASWATQDAVVLPA
jgi:putrescine transport system ATP-binding protein